MTGPSATGEAAVNIPCVADMVVVWAVFVVMPLAFPLSVVSPELDKQGEEFTIRAELVTLQALLSAVVDVVTALSELALVLVTKV